MFKTRIVGLLALMALPVLTGCLGGGGSGDDVCGPNGVRLCKEYGEGMDCTTRGSSTTCRPTKECLSWTCHYGSPTSYGTVIPAREAFRIKLGELTIDRAMGMIANADRMTARQAGLVDADVEAVLADQPLSSGRVREMARIHGVNERELARKIELVTEAFKEQRQRSDSVYWQTCIRSGKWATPQNMNCEKTFWPGCSPETGANLCVSEVGLKRLAK